MKDHFHFFAYSPISSKCCRSNNVGPLIDYLTLFKKADIQNILASTMLRFQLLLAQFNAYSPLRAAWQSSGQSAGLACCRSQVRVRPGDGNFLSFNLVLNESNKNQVSLVRYRAYNPSGVDSTISSRSKSATDSTPYDKQRSACQCVCTLSFPSK